MPPTPRVRKPKPKPGTEPFGHARRVVVAKHRPESRPLKVADIAVLLSLSATAVRDRDRQLRPALVGLAGKRQRRYSWASFVAYLESATPQE